MDQTRARTSMAFSAIGVLVLILTPLLLGTVAPLSAQGSPGRPQGAAPLSQQDFDSVDPSAPPPNRPSATQNGNGISAAPRPSKVAAPASTPASTPAAPSSSTPDCRVTKCIALTFDDGPGDYTDQVLSILKAANAHASFFMIGSQISSYPAQVRRVEAEGHDLGNHTWSHPRLAGMSVAGQQRQIDRTQAAFAAAGVKPPTMMRPPFGDYDANTARLGLAVAMWSVDTEDWLNKNAATTTQRALATAQPGGIILLHEIHQSTVAALPGLIAALQAQGYTVVSMTQMCGAEVKPGAVLRTCGVPA